VVLWGDADVLCTLVRKNNPCAQHTLLYLLPAYGLVQASWTRQSMFCACKECSITTYFTVTHSTQAAWQHLQLKVVHHTMLAQQLWQTAGFSAAHTVVSKQPLHNQLAVLHVPGSSTW
jgi:hypothetical protein